MEKKILFLVFCPKGLGQLVGLQKFGQKIKKWLGVGGNDTFYFLTDWFLEKLGGEIRTILDIFKIQNRLDFLNKKE